MSKIYLYLGVGALIIILSYALVKVYKQNVLLEQHITELKVEADLNAKTISDMNNSILEYSKLNSDISKEFAKNQNELNKKTEILTNHNLEKIISKKPTLIIKKINVKTNEIFSDFSEFTQNTHNTKDESDESNE